MNLNKRIEDAFSHLVEKSGVSAGQVVGLLKDIGTLNGGAVVPSRVEGDDAYFVSRIGHALNRQAIYYCNALTNNTSATFLGDKYRKDLLSDGESSEDGSTPASAFVHVEDRRIRALRNKPTGLTYFRQYLKNGESLAPEMHPDVVMSELLATRARLASHVAGDIVPGRYTTRFMLENFKRLADGSAAGRARMAVRARDRVSVLYNATYFDQLLESIDGAAQEISVLMFFFPYDGRRTRAVTTKVFRALVNAHGRGVKVTVVLDRDRKEDKYFTRKVNANTIRALRRAGIDARFDAVESVTHSKIITVDGRYTFLGAHNLSNSASYRYEEISLLVDSRALADHYTRLIEHSE